jgi:hypothetical protein
MGVLADKLVHKGLATKKSTFEGEREELQQIKPERKIQFIFKGKFKKTCGNDILCSA